MKKKNLLITCAGGSGPIYLAWRLQARYNIFLADATDQNMGSKLGRPFQIVPFGNHPRYRGIMTKLIKKWSIDIVAPGAEEELAPLHKIQEFHPRLLVVMPGNPAFTRLCLDKSRLMRVLDDLEISRLLPYRHPSAVKYPAVAKPNNGRGSRDFHILRNRRELKGYLDLYGRKFSQILCQPYIAGVEYTVSAIVNDRNRIIGIVPKRIINKRGITRAAVSERQPLIDKACVRIVAALKPAGPFNVQLKIFKGHVYIFEINPRLSTTSVLTDQAFGNEVELFVRYHGQEKIAKPPVLKRNVYLYRYEENYFEHR